MKSNFKHRTQPYFFIIFLILFAPQLFAQDIEFNKQDEQLVLQNPDLVLWHVKALTAKGQILHVKVVDKDGKHHPVKAIQETENAQILDVKSFINGKQLPIKLLPKKNERYYPFKAIAEDGTLIDIKALGEDGALFDVVGVIKIGNVVHIRAVNPEGALYNIIAISPSGRTNDVSGIKMMKEEVEATFRGVPIFSHVKAITRQ
ncbi:MAG: hypothetical protein HKN00_00565 [Flavobacteriaceae bacterium]|nr:hypothetical protein [Bacteroidia bacterium]NNF73648.1 hypothetical protein [Flavobacteriaceae bacterium]NNK73975.1 hypothetical protein [Flavobacteriaceae bacterium]